MVVFPNAKINIGLNVVSRREDGYHNLETIFYPVKLADALEIAESDETEFSYSGLHIDGAPESNLVYKAYSLLKSDFELPGLKIHLHKVIPFGAGLGGGSSDAAFVLKLINEYCSLGLNSTELKQYAKKIGADCPFFIENKASFARGIGDQLEPIQIDLSKFEIVIVKPQISVSTPDAYRNIKPSQPSFNLKELNKIPFEEWRDFVVNDFEKTVFPKYPEIQSIKEALYKMGALYAAMSGSGSAVFGIFRHLPANTDKFLPKGIFIYR
ncbi:4-(cytidine 5'-diphospho)-2-C-methyl-D-erythritol kinase [Maribellus maritimus]|uniref:4-(cytidine 5'-diphospho)-2-C-methyl-D-erythritol kinase n=1 Tax=Maribellus maritimus TaxID=2870838 RepID=UPI001EEAAC0C|nr:4-(cytidine 5'-diphospho)-2-C-methyl-D-erythritol kinase [Maribellus maritimus]MCG6186097.1 4-(cytidine 5'-diphospho)-2-C-methyl-D-erythritol kinase [Maribellus maritimus]